MEIIINLLYIYIAIYSVYFLILAIKNLNDKKFRIEKKYDTPNYANNLCVIIYSHNNDSRLEALVNQLKKQTYPRQNFSTYLILDNCNDNSERIFFNDEFVELFCIKDQGTIGKDQSISILLEKLSATQTCNAYVFLDANRLIDTDFLSSVNAALAKSPVVSGQTELVCENLNLRQKIKLTFHKYQMNFLNKGRSLLGLAMIIDSDMLAMRQDLMEKIGCIDFQNINSELKYSLLLSKIGCKCTFNPNIKTYIDIDDFKLRIPSITKRLGLFKSCFAQIWGKNIVFNEHVWSLLAPNVIVLLGLYCYLIYCTMNFYCMFDITVVTISLCVLILAFSLSLINSGLKGKEFLYLFLYPVYSMMHIIRNFPPIRMIRNRMAIKRKIAKNTEKMIVEVFVSDGKKVIPCKLALISESGLAKVVFIFRKKKFATKSHLRMVDAITELTKKLEDYGFTLKICQCCCYFTPNIDGSTNMVKGFCKRKFANMEAEGEMPTLLWNSCKGFNKNSSNDVIEEIFN